jgi:hypothetical protein
VYIPAGKAIPIAKLECPECFDVDVSWIKRILEDEDYT